MSEQDGNAPNPWDWATRDQDINGTAADDTLHGGKGRNRIDGGGGTDTLDLGGSLWRDYQVTHDTATDTYTISYRYAPDREVDTLSSVERLRFHDIEAPIAAFAEGAPAELRPIDFASTEGADVLVGREYDERIDGDRGDDMMRGNGGNDILYGGKGEDTALYAGNVADYELIFDHTARQYRVTDREPGRDGSDLIGYVEKLRFADVTVLLTGDQGARIEGGAELLPAWVPPPYPGTFDVPFTSAFASAAGDAPPGTAPAAEPVLVGTAWALAMLPFDV